MAKITIYLPDELERKARKTARQNHLSVSRWIADQVAQKLSNTWPPEFLEALGSCPDFPDLEELRRGYGEDVRREYLD
jgi:hypothetical protein